MSERDSEPREGEYLPARGAAERGFAGMRFPKLFAIVVLLFVADVLLPDFIPFVDEIILGALAVMLGMLRKKTRGDPEPPPRP